MAGHNKHLHLLSLPQEIIENILYYISYDDISNLRMVSKNFDKLCQNQLNQGFARVDKFHSIIQKEVKSQLPRRESERRNHPLARHVDILAAIETRLSLLSMTYMKYISMGACCFIPGKVLDELYKVLRNIRNTGTPPRSHELLQELRDISSMAMEHFDEKIVPAIKSKITTGPVQMALNSSFPGASGNSVAGAMSASFSPLSSPGCSDISVRFSTPQPATENRIPVRHPLLLKEMMQVKQNLRSNATSLLTLKHELRDHKAKFNCQQKKTQEQARKLVRQDKLLLLQSRKITEQEKLINDLNRKIMEYDQKFVDMMSEISRVRSIKASGDSKDVDNNGNPEVSAGSSSAITHNCGKGQRGKKRKYIAEKSGQSDIANHSRPKRNIKRPNRL